MEAPAYARHQHGMLLPALAILLSLGGLGWLLARQDNAADRAARQLAQEMHTARALGIARDALIGFAATYRNREHPNADFGYLPCPDLDGDGSSETCGAQDQTSVGRLPYLTLNLPDLRDGSGECLWYAVSGSFKNNPKAAVLNWDSGGRFRLLDGNHQIVALPGDQDGLAAAIVIAAGRPLPGQDRTAGPGRCGGDQEARNIQHYVESLSAVSGTGIIDVHTDTPNSNDRIVAITGGDIYRHLKSRDSYSTHLQSVLQATADCLQAARLPAPLEPAHHGPVTLGRLPVLNRTSGQCNHDNMRDPAGNWGEMMRYARCTDGTDCLSGANGRCAGALLFGGERLNNAQHRTNAEERKSTEQYLEPATLAALSAGQLSSLADKIVMPFIARKTAATSDIALCLHAAP